jgi:hypothetical protein
MPLIRTRIFIGFYWSRKKKFKEWSCWCLLNLCSIVCIREQESFMIKIKECVKRKNNLLYVCMCVVHKDKVCASKTTWKNILCNKK